MEKLKQKRSWKSDRLFESSDYEFLRTVLREVPSGTTILDAGCRSGDLVLFLLQLGMNAYGSDINEENIRDIQNSHQSLKDRFFIQDISNEKDISELKFDLIFCFGVMPYIDPLLWNKSVSNLLANLTSESSKVYITFLKYKSLPVTLIQAVLNKINYGFYNKIIAPSILILIFPFSELLFGEKISYSLLRYKFAQSLHGINYGYPLHLNKYAINLDGGGLFSKKNSEIFLISKSESSNLAKFNSEV